MIAYFNINRTDLLTPSELISRKIKIMKEEIIIPLSKTKMILLLLAAIVFVALGIWFVMSPETFVDEGEPTGFITFMGGLSIAFFGVGSILIFRKLFDTKPGLVINKEGILDNSSAASVGLIKWEDIIGFAIVEVSGQKIILPQVKNPEAYLDRQASTIKKKMMSMNYKLYKTPLSITANALKYKTDDLIDLLEVELLKRQ